MMALTTKAHHLLNEAQQEAEYELEANIVKAWSFHVYEGVRGVDSVISDVTNEIWAMANTLWRNKCVSTFRFKAQGPKHKHSCE
jgi:hypothetical protein